MSHCGTSWHGFAREREPALSDNPAFVHVFPRTDAFDRFFWSAELGLTKPARAIFTRVSQEMKTAPADIVFVDDSVANVEAARACGWDAILYSSNERLLNDLAKRGFRIDQGDCTS